MPVVYRCRRCGAILHVVKAPIGSYGIPTPYDVLSWYGGVCPYCLSKLSVGGIRASVKIDGISVDDDGDEDSVGVRCPYCGAPVYRIGDILVCANGHVIDDSIVDVGAEYRAYDANEYVAKARASPIHETIHDYGVSTVIGRGENSLDRLNKRARIGDKNAQFIVSVFQELNRITLVLGVPEYVREYAARLARRALEDVLEDPREYGCGRSEKSTAAIAAAALVVAARSEGLYYIADRIPSVTRIARKCYSRVRALLNAKLDTGVKSAGVKATVKRILERVGATPAAYKLADMIVDAMYTVRGGSIARRGFEAAIAYLSCKVTQKNCSMAAVAKAARVTDATIRKWYRDIINRVTIYVYM